MSDISAKDLRDIYVLAATGSNVITFSIIVLTPTVFRHEPLDIPTSRPHTTAFQIGLRLSALTTSSTFLYIGFVWPQINSEKFEHINNIQYNPCRCMSTYVLP